MADDLSQSSQHGSNLLTHLPLPYRVRIRLVADDDRPPDFREISVIAYSVIEAVMQVSIQYGAGGDLVGNGHVRIEAVEPDQGLYARMYADSLVAAALLRGPRP